MSKRVVGVVGMLKRIFGLCSFWVALAIKLATPALSLEFNIEQTKRAIFIEASGDIEEGDTDRLRKIYENYPRSRYLVLNSNGGSIYESVRLGMFVRNSDLETYIPSGSSCLSACFFVYIAGNYRDISEEGKLGVHQFYGKSSEKSDNDVQSTSQLVSAELINYTLNMGASIEAIEIALRTPPNSMHIFTRDELNLYGLIGQPKLEMFGPPRSGKCWIPKYFVIKNMKDFAPECVP